MAVVVTAEAAIGCGVVGELSRSARRRPPMSCSNMCFHCPIAGFSLRAQPHSIPHTVTPSPHRSLLLVVISACSRCAVLLLLADRFKIQCTQDAAFLWDSVMEQGTAGFWVTASDAAAEQHKQAAATSKFFRLCASDLCSNVPMSLRLSRCTDLTNVETDGTDIRLSLTSCKQQFNDIYAINFPSFQMPDETVPFVCRRTPTP